MDYKKINITDKHHFTRHEHYERKCWKCVRNS